MFAILLKSRIEIEAQISSLHKTYLALLRMPIDPKINSNNSDSKAQNIIEENIEKLNKLKLEYAEAIKQHENITKELAAAQETAENLEEQLDNLFAALHIEIPDHLQKPNPGSSTFTKLEVESPSADEEDKENSHSEFDKQQEEEGDDVDSDKENSRIYTDYSSSNEYFSPTVVIQKSNSECYTPAVKSNSKLPLLKRNSWRKWFEDLSTNFSHATWNQFPV